jgi:dolichyl-diphosphooligosaccharide--protein glycosyltransferase
MSAILVGLGSPTGSLVARFLLVAPAVSGALADFTRYYIGQQLTDRFTGLFGAIVLVILPWTFLQRTLLGFDNNSIEPLARDSYSPRRARTRPWPSPQ